MKWYKNNYRRHLLDMHVEDWDERFLSEFSPEEYVENLKLAKIQCAMIYLQSHVGLCYFPTKVAEEHRAFKGNDKIQKLVRLCRDNGIKVVGYYSLIYNNWAEINHPEWKMIGPDGKTQREKGGRYGFACPNNEDYRAFVAEQIKEISENFELDGMFYDMPFWPENCRCSSCRERWEKEVGGNMPDPSDLSPQFKTYAKKLQEWMAEFCAFVAEKTHEIMPEVTIEFNNAGIIAFGWNAGSTEKISDLADYAGGDLYGDLAAHSFSCKYYYSVTQNQPFEYMNSRCVSLQEHTATKDPEYLETEIALTRAHHGATFIIDAIDPVGTMDKRVYELLGKLFSEQETLEKYNEGELVADVAVFYDSSATFDESRVGFGNREASIAATRRLTERHVPVAVIGNGHTGDLSRFKCVVAPMLQNFGNPEVEKLIKYVDDGGNLYIDGASDSRLIERLIGGKNKGFVGTSMTYIAPKSGCENTLSDFNIKYPMPFNYKLAEVVAADDAEILAYAVLPRTVPEDNIHFASIHSNPPWERTKVPAIIKRNAGKGTVIWCAGAIEKDDKNAFGDAFLSLINEMTGGDYTVSAKASKNIETITFKADGVFYLSAVSLSADALCEYPVEITVKTESKPTYIKNLSSGEMLPFNFAAGKTSFKDSIKLHSTYRIKL